MRKVGIIGIGRWGKRLLVEFEQISEVAVACTNGNESNIEWLSSNFPSIKHTTNYKEILEDNSIEVIVVATPISTHFAIAKQALESGKHVFCEKPLATTLKEAEELKTCALEQGKIIFTGYTFLYNEVFQRIKELATINKITGIHVNWNKMGTFKENIYWNLLTHPISIFQELLGEVAILDVNEGVGIISNNDIVFANVVAKEVPCTIYINRFSNVNSFQLTVKTLDYTYLWKDLSLYQYTDVGIEEIFVASKSALANECKYFIDLLSNASDKNNLDVSVSVTKSIVEVIN